MARMAMATAWGVLPFLLPHHGHGEIPPVETFFGQHRPGERNLVQQDMFSWRKIMVIGCTVEGLMQVRCMEGLYLIGIPTPQLAHQSLKVNDGGMHDGSG